MSGRDRLPTLSDVEELVAQKLKLESQERSLIDGWLETKFSKVVEGFEKRLERLERKQTFYHVLTVLGAIVGGYFGSVFK